MNKINYRNAAVCIALYSVLAVILFWEPLFTDSVFLPCSPKEWSPWNKTNDFELSNQPLKSNRLLSDGPLVNFIWKFYNHQTFRQWRIPFWNPFILSGAPHVAELSSLALYPLTIPFDYWDPFLGNVYSLIIHLIIAGCLMFLFLRKIGLEFGPALIGGVIFEFNGFFLANMGFPAVVIAGTWTPFLLIGIHDVIREKHWVSSWKIAVPVFGMMLAGFPQILVISLFLGISWACFQGWKRIQQENNFKLVIKRIMAIPLLVLLGLGLAGVGVCPFIEFLKQTARRPVQFNNCQFASMPALTMIQAVIPDFFGNPVNHNYWLHETQSFFHSQPDGTHSWRWNYSSQNLFIGIAPLLLALYGLFCFRSRESLFFGSMAAIALLVLFGATLVLKMFYNFVPTFNYSRPDRIAFLYMFSVSVLAAMGCSYASKRISTARVAKWIPWAIFLLPILPSVAAYSFLPKYREALLSFFHFAQPKVLFFRGIILDQFWETLAVAILLAILIFLLRLFPQRQQFIYMGILLLIILPLFKFFWRFSPMQRPPVFPQTNAVDFLQRQKGLFRIAHFGMALPPNTNIIYKLFSANGISVAPLNCYSRLVHNALPNAFQRDKYFMSFSKPSVLKSSLLNFLNVSYFISPKPLHLPGLQLHSKETNFFVYQNPESLPRFFLVDRVEIIDSPEQGLKKFYKKSFDPKRTALIEASANIALPDSPFISDSERFRSTKLISYQPHRIVLQVYADSRRLMVSSEVIYPGWFVKIDGKITDIVEVNTAFRGVVVPAGDHQICFYYIPVSFYIGLGITTISSFILLGIFVFCIVKKEH